MKGYAHLFYTSQGSVYRKYKEMQRSKIYNQPISSSAVVFVNQQKEIIITVGVEAA